MKRTALPMLARWLAAVVLVATTEAGATESPNDWPGYAPKPFRWDEDYRRLKGRTDLPVPLNLKFIPLVLQPDGYVSFGGEYRVRVDDYDRPDFGARHAPDFTSWQQRFLAHADVHVSDAVRVFVQLGDDSETGRKPVARPADKSQVDLAQGFVDIGIGESDARWRLRLGRQEVAIGRYIAVREVTNIRRTFDGVRADGPLGGWTITALAANATRNRPDAFDDDPDPKDKVALAVAEHALPFAGFKFDLAAIEHENDSARYAAGSGVEHRGTLGARLFGNAGPWDLDAQVSHQSGSFTPTAKPSLHIDAWGAAFEGGRTLHLPWTPRLALRLDAAGGDSNAKDRTLQTFDLPYPNLSYLTDAALFAPRNVHDVQPFVTVTPRKSLTLTAGAQFLWRNSLADAVYSPLNTPVLPAGGSGHYVASEPYVRWSWRPVSLVEVQGGVVHATPGDALRTINGRRALDYAFSSIAVKL